MALPAYLSLEGAKTGVIHGGATQKGRQGKIMVVAYSHEVLSPRDPSSGLPSGVRQHKPLVITKELDSATPRLYQMLATNENIAKWELEFWRPGSTGGPEQQHFTIRLNDANIVNITARMPNCRDANLAKIETYEEVAFTYQSIEWTWMDGGVVAADEWSPMLA
jgi:type VI secretion system secreted protein Hcp